MLMRSLVGVAVVMLVSALLAPARGLAQGFREAEIEFNRGELLLEMRDSQRAIFALKKAYSIIPDKRYLAALARAHDQKGDVENALICAERYVAIAGETADSDIVDLAARLKEQMAGERGRVKVVVSPEGGKLTLLAADGWQDSQVAGTRVVERWLPLGKAELAYEKDGYAALRVSVAVAADKTAEANLVLAPQKGAAELVVDANVDNARVTIDGADAGVAPVKKKVAAGDHVVQVWAPNHLAWVGVIDAPAERAVSVQAKLTPSKTPVSRMPVTTLVFDESGGWGLSTWGWITMGAGVATLGAAGYFYFQMLQTLNEANALPAGEEKDQKAAELSTQWTLTLACGVAGGVAAGGGLLMVLLDDSAEDAEVAPFELLTLSPVVTDDAFVLDAAWSF